MTLKTLGANKIDRYLCQYDASFFNLNNNMHSLESVIEIRNSLVKIIGLNNLFSDSVDSTDSVLLEKIQSSDDENLLLDSMDSTDSVLLEKIQSSDDENLLLDSIGLIDGVPLEKIQPSYRKNLLLDSIGLIDGVPLEKIQPIFINNYYIKVFYSLNKIDYINDDINIDKEIETFYSLSKTDIIEDGIYSESEKFINSIMKENFCLAMSILSGAYIKYSSQTNILISIFNIMSGLDYSRVSDMSYIKQLIGSYLSSNDDLVIEQALKFFDNCGTKKDIDILNGVKPIKTQWIEDYRKEIISYLSK